MTRAEHIAWCKERALTYLPDDPKGALASFLSDIQKHEETSHLLGTQFTAEQVRKHIEGFN